MRFLFLCILFTLFFGKHSFSQSFTDSNLPIVIIRTDKGIEIPDEPKIPASMKVIFNGQGKRNYLTDQNSTGSLNYNGKIMIEIRGVFHSVASQEAVWPYNGKSRQCDQ